MTQARFSIGIDLGTTNCALAYVPLDGEASSSVMEIPQWDSLSSLVSLPTLPSFLYLPEPAVAEQIQGKVAGKGEWIVGRLARKRSGEVPDRVAHSAKSWLCHHAADRSAPFLPWGSDSISQDKKISPIRATALILNYLRSAWNTTFGVTGFDFDAQEITITVPASFDAVAQRLTLTAAEEAGFPATVRLLEEPQAAFYRWLEQHGSGTDVWRHLPDRGGDTHHVLVLDIGGGTSDFSLFALTGNTAGTTPGIRRIAVSDHILLGGDNMDLAIAHLLEPRLAGDEGTFSGGQWDSLVARCRDLKEKALCSEGSPDERLRVTIPGRGASLVAGSLTTETTRAEIEQVLLAGFFPECDADERPYQTQAALKEWGLPYASDSAVTRHLADFLRGRPPVDAVLFNGGALYPGSLRERICREIGKWQQDSTPVVLDNAEPDLAVARGAARFGKIIHRKAARIEAGAGRAVFIEALKEAARQPAEQSTANAKEKGRRSLVCILPRGAPPEQTFAINEVALQLRVNRPVRFQTFSSTRHGQTKPGEIVAWSPANFHPLPPLETVVKLPEEGRAGNRDGGRTIPVTLTAKLNELGLLQVSCHSADARIRQEWPLEFNLRPHEQDGAGPSQVSTTSAVSPEPNAAPGAIDAARMRIESVFGQPLNRRDKLTAARMLGSLEKILGLPKAEWNWVLIRALWPSLETCMDCRKHSVEHEESWLILAGFMLRPGFGAPMDPVRIDSLWRIRDTGLFFPGKRIKLQEYILWRRVAGGLDRERQESILAGELDKIRQQKNPPPELIRLVGSLERIDHEIKKELIDRLIATVMDLAHEKKHFAPYLAALGLLLNRAPLYAGPEAVVPPDLVEQAYDALAPLNWTDPEISEIQTLFLRAARVVGNRSLDLAERRRYRIAGRLEKAGVTPLKTGKLKDLMPVDRSERISLYGEALPPGLILGES
jgi:molecular chaperone DnaK (HSP70)